MRVVDDEDDEMGERRAPLMTRARRAATKRTVTTQKTRIRAGDDDEEEEEEEEEAAMTASEGDDDKEEEDEEEDEERRADAEAKDCEIQRGGGERVVEAPFRSVVRLERRERTPGKKVAVRDEVEKINARTSGPLDDYERTKRATPIAP